MTEQDVIPGGRPELVLRFQRPEAIAVCRDVPKLGCSAPFYLSGNGWTVHDRFVDGDLVLDPGSGKPPSGVLGRHRLFDR
jgi:hypothetical protein